jgi:hypothetical protein
MEYLAGNMIEVAAARHLREIKSCDRKLRIEGR